MGTVTERLAILIDADAKGALREFESVGTRVKTTDDKIAKLSGQMTKFGIAAVSAGGLAAAGLYKFASAAGDYGESVSAAGVIFGAASKDVEKFGESASKSAGLSKKAAVDGANTFGTFGKAAGLADSDLTGFSTRLVQLAGDFASFKNTTPEEAIEAIGAALRGEMEPIRRYGVLLDDAALRQEALTLGIYDGNGSLTSQQKILAANSAIFKQSSDAQGDYTRTSESFANQQRTLKADLENLKIEIGQGVLPVFSKLVSGLSDAVGAFNELPGPAKETVGAIAAFGTAGTVAVGALSLVGGQLVKVVTFAKTATTALTGVSEVSFGGLIGGLGSIPALAATAAAGIYVIADAARAAEAAAAVSASNLTAAFDPKNADAFTDTIGDVEKAFNSLTTSNDVQDWIGDTAKGLAEIASVNPEGARKLADEIVRIIEGSDFEGEAVGAWLAFTDAIDGTGAAARGADALIGGLGGTVADTGDEYKTTTDAVKGLSDALNAQIDPFFAAQDAAKNLVDAQQAVNDAAKEHGKNSPEYQKALRDQATAGLELQTALATINSTLKDNPAAAKGAVESLVRMKDQGLITKQEFDNLAGQILRTIAVAKTEPDFNINVGPARTAIDGVMAKIRSLPKAFGWTLTPTTTPPADGQASGGLVSFAAGGFPSGPTILPNRPGGLIQGFEGRTGYEEAWIPTDPKYRGRAISIWQQTGKKLGMMAAGGVTGALFGNQTVAGHTNQEWSNLAKAIEAGSKGSKSKRTAGHTDEEWRNLAEAIRRQDDLSREKTSNMWDAQFKAASGNIDKQIAMLVQKSRGLDPWTDEWTAVRNQVSDLKAEKTGRAASLQQEIADNQWEAALYQAEAAGDFKKQVDLLSGRQKKLQPWTDEWWALQQDIWRVQKSQSEAQTRAAEQSTGGAGVTVNVSVGAMTDPAEVGRQVKDVLLAYEARNGTGWRR